MSSIRNAIAWTAAILAVVAWVFAAIFLGAIIKAWLGAAPGQVSDAGMGQVIVVCLAAIGAILFAGFKFLHRGGQSGA